jgi:osmotically-inducible protein OsmY
LIVAAAMVAMIVSGLLIASSVNDIDITTAVEGEFWADDVVDPNRIDVATEDGVVTLTGIASNILVKQRAAAIAAGTSGVRVVVNDIEVVPVARRTDLELEEAVRDALLADPATESYEVEVTADSGGIVLEGKLEVRVEEEVHVLNAGDNIIIESSRPHKMRNCTDKTTKTIWIDSPPTF